jgi:pyruvate,orthophosphate dikinase
MILADTLEAEGGAGEVTVAQRDDFAGIFRALDGYPATILPGPAAARLPPHTPEQQKDCEEARHLSREDSLAGRAAA